MNWVETLSQENLLAIYDVLLDIDKEMQLAVDVRVAISVLPQVIRFPQLFPADTIGLRDQYCELRWKAVGYLKKVGIIKAFSYSDTGLHRWENSIDVVADNKKISEAVETVKHTLSKSTRASTVTMERTKVFIGHGRSDLWRKLKDFLAERLHLDWEEYNRTSTAGKSRKEVLLEKMAQARFAFLVMTAEDEHSDGTRHARENVIHEVGLFQATLGFECAIVVLEEGCQEFSNIAGLDQIRFPKGQIEGAWENIRQVLERERILPKSE